MSLQKMSDPNSKAPFLVWRVSQFSDYVRYCEKYCFDDFTVFRGHREDWPLLPKIARVKHIGGLIYNEKHIFADFKRKAVAFLDSEPSNDWDWLSIAQHHGLPTRLLDWTKNAHAGLWFAVRKPSSKKTKDGVVWVFRPAKKDILQELDDGSSPFVGGRTKVFEPRHVVPRIRAQDGVFTVHKYSKKFGRFISLERNVVHRDRLEKILISGKHFAAIRYELDRAGIHAGSLFPDINGLTEHITWEYTLVGDED